MSQMQRNGQHDPLYDGVEMPKAEEDRREEEKARREVEEARRRENRIKRILIAVIVVASILLVISLLLPRILPQQLAWSQWTEKPPLYVWLGNYEMQWMSAYRSRQLEYTYSTTESQLPGWECYKVEQVGPWSQWSTEPMAALEAQEVESRVMHRYPVRETTQSSSSTMSGWTLSHVTYDPEGYGAWSDWSDTPTEESDTREVQTKLRYRSRTVGYENTYSEMSSWRDKPVAASDTTIVETRTLYAYYYFYCFQCGDIYRYPYWGVMKCDGCGGKILEQSETICYLEQPHGDSLPWRDTPRLCQYIGGEVYFNFTNEERPNYPEWKRQYRYATLTGQTRTEGAWSGWQDDAISSSAELEVESCTFYQYRLRTPVYHYERISGWSDWVATIPEHVSGGDVESATCYRWRDLNKTTYHFRRWGAWSECTADPITATDEMKVEKVKLYRYRSK